MNELDEKGFVFLDDASRPYWCRVWCDNPWLFYWHPDYKFVSLRQVTQADIFGFPHNLSEEEQQIYIDKHWESQDEMRPLKG